MSEKPQYSPSTDPLTGLISIADFDRRAEELLKSPQYDGIEFNIAYFNIGNMKAYNERFGMEAGDELLVLAARTIESSFEHVLASRIGDDRFVLLTYGNDLIEGITRVHEAVLDHNRELRTTIRAGVFAHDGQADIILACDRAKLACDHIKSRYDVFWYLYDETLLESRNRRQFILNKFEMALREGHIQVHYQPILRTIGARVTDFEALARWIDPDEGFISPAEFIPVLEDARLVHKLDLHIVETVCKQYHYVIEQGFPMAPANVNLSPLDLELCDIVTETHAIMQRYDVPANMLNIEITESAFAQSGELLRKTIDRFHELGMQVWMDDFGSGYSSLNVLREFPFDVVKFDMSFLRHRDEYSRAKLESMLPHIIIMMKVLGIQTLMEGVETQAQHELLARVGCEKVQGYYFAKPTPVGEFAPRIAAGEFKVEQASQRDYMDLIGRIDLTAPAAIDSELGHEIELSSGLPAAIVEFSGGKVRYLAWNSSYLDYLRDIGMMTIENSTNQMNDMSRLQSQGFHAAAAKMRGKYEWISLAFYEGDDLCTGRARCIALDEEADACAFVYIAFNISRFLAETGLSLPKTLLGGPLGQSGDE